MGTTWTVKFGQSASSLTPPAVEPPVVARLHQLELIFSTYRADSELTRFNANESTAWFPVSLELARAAVTAREISELTDGAFDVTVAPLVRAWGFGPAGRPVIFPTAATIAALRSNVDWRGLMGRLEPPAIRRNRERITVDFSSFAKGLACDILSDDLVRLGASDHFLQIGGDVRTRGKAGDGRPWRVGIEEPVEGQRAVALVVGLTGQALSTSGDYRNFFTEEGRRLGHIIDPRTGHPVANELAAVSVIHDSAATSSAVATALFVLGLKSGFALAEAQGLACVFFIRRHGLIEKSTTSAWAAYQR